MAGTLRKLVTRLVLEGAKAASNQLRGYDALWKATAKSVESSAAAIEKAAERAGRALAGMREGAAAVRVGAGAARAGGGGGGRPRPARTSDPEIDRIVREGQREAARQAKAQERAAKEAQREAEKNARAAERSAAADAKSQARRSRAHDAGERAANISGARQAGLAAGAAPINDATKALGLFATASDRAKAKVSDLTAQVERNRKEMAELRVKAIQTGDADGTLAARMQGLSAKTNEVSGRLREARRELRAVDGGLIDTIRNTANLSGRFDALKVAAGNLLSGAVSRGLHGIGDALVGSAKSAMDFETALVDVAKVAQDADLTKEGLLDPRVKQGIKDVAKELGVMPTEVAELTAQITAAFSGKTDIVALASDVTKIGVAWDISGKQAGEFFKQTSAGLQINSDETKMLFGSINELGNRLGIKSAEIAEAMTRSAGVIKGANLSGETGAALNATLIKAGASAEVAATGVRTFIARLGAGEAATDKQIHAFQALGLSAESVAKNLASGDAARAEAQIKEVVGALVKMGEESPEKRLATLIELFGSESIGSIGAAATAVETLASSFEIAGNKAAAATSVQQEYDRVSDTSAKRVEKLKANIGVLAIEFGEKLLPYIDRFVTFLTSPEGQEWGASAVEKAVGAVTSFAEVVGFVVKALSSASEAIGGTTVAIGLLAVAVGALLGPWGLLLTGAVALGQYLGGEFPKQLEAARQAELALAKSLVDGRAAMTDLVTDLRRHDGVFAKVSDRWREMMLRIMGATNALGEFYRKQDAEEVRAGKLAHEEAKRREEDRQREEHAVRTRAAAEADADRRRASVEVAKPKEIGDLIGAKGRVDLSGVSDQAKQSMFKDLVSRRKTLKPSEQKVLKALSKDLDERIPTSSGRAHKMTKMDKQLAAIDPSLRSVLTQGGDTDKGGDAMVSDDPLSRAVLGAASARKGLGSVSGGSGGVGPGPNITNTYNNTTINVQQAIDARSTASVPENIRSAARESGNQAAGVILTGVDRARALKQGGARMV